MSKSKFRVQCPRCMATRTYNIQPGIRELDARCPKCGNWPTDAARNRALLYAVLDAKQALLKIGDISRASFVNCDMNEWVEQLGDLHFSMTESARSDICAKCGQLSRPDYVHPDSAWSRFFCSCVELTDAERMAAHNAMLRAVEEE